MDGAYGSRLGATLRYGPLTSLRPSSERSLLRFAPLVMLGAMFIPVMAGLAGTLLPALGYFPAAGGHTVELNAVRDLIHWPGFWKSATLSVTTGVGVTLLSLGIVMLFTAAWQGTRIFAFMERVLSPLLAIPHAAAAFGIAFLLAPSGWIARLVSPWATGWVTPPDWLIPQDPWGISMMAGLVAKEVPFLLIMTLAALGQTESARSRVTAQSLGYGRTWAWMTVVFPRIYEQIRLPVYAVLAYAMSVVDVAIILGPNAPATLSAQVVSWMSDPDLAMRFRASAGALAQLGLVGGTLLLWRAGELSIARAACRWVERGRRMKRDRLLRWGGLVLAASTIAMVLFGLLSLFVWSFSGFWSYPAFLPDAFSLATWMRHAPELADPIVETVRIGALAVGFSLVLSLFTLEAEQRFKLNLTTRRLGLLYAPLLIPQVAFLVGLQTLALQSGLAAGTTAVTVAHVVFVLPYVFLSIAGPYRAWDNRYAIISSAMGAGSQRTLWRIRLPMLAGPLLVACAIGFAVSVGQYLPTLLIGAGRVQTLTTEAVALASGGDRRVIGVFALTQTVVAVVPFMIALAVPRFLWRHRRDLQHR